ncbi:hypothetical protein PMO31_07735, partial [Bifidobacterium longum]|nr:hypothetical protein [Bifidobacterium longum]
MSEPVRVLVLDTVMDRGGAETMTMNYLRRMDRSKVQYDLAFRCLVWVGLSGGDGAEVEFAAGQV